MLTCLLKFQEENQMDFREKKIVDTYMSKEPEIGQWLWAFRDARQRTMRELDGLTPAMIDWLPPDNESSIGTVLYHIADIEADWLYVEVLEQPIPPNVAALFSYPTRDEQGHLTQVQAVSLEAHLSRLETVRGLALDVYQQMNLADFRRARSLPNYDVTPEWVLHHLMQHEAEHRSQIRALRARAERSLTLG
jgi:uncharacterized damage-inducible protein DinB